MVSYRICEPILHAGRRRREGAERLLLPTWAKVKSISPLLTCFPPTHPQPQGRPSPPAKRVVLLLEPAFSRRHLIRVLWILGSGVGGVGEQTEIHIVRDRLSDFCQVRRRFPHGRENKQPRESRGGSGETRVLQWCLLGEQHLFQPTLPRCTGQDLTTLALEPVYLQGCLCQRAGRERRLGGDCQNRWQGSLLTSCS